MIENILIAKNLFLKNLIEPIHELSALISKMEVNKGNNKNYDSGSSPHSFCLVFQASKALFMWQPGKPFCLTSE